MRDWELVDSDRFSFEDSDRFEEDSLCSWISEPESLCNNWRGWKKSNFPNSASNSILSNGNGGPAGSGASAPGISGSAKKKDFQPEVHLNLVELSARCVASHIPFEMVERFYPPVPEQLQLRIAFWSFPEYEEDIRLYSCLANGSAEEFSKGEKLFKSDSVGDTLQIGFHLSATVRNNLREAHKVAITFDRRRITSCTCTCNASTNWCGHVVAVCLHRIFLSKDVTLRAPVSESLSRLHRDQLQKFAQYLISELPQQILPTAQRLLDELLSSQRSAINTLRGAPDPTAGASANEQTSWYLDERTLHGNIHKILIKFCVPAPIVFSDVNYLTSAAPPASAEWSSLLRPLRGREPEGMWNLLSIVREMFRREDRNAVPLLEIITEECLNCDQILVWWFNTKVALHNGNSGHSGKHHSVNSNAHACQHAGSSLCDEIVLLWRLAALNPGLSPDERCILHNQFKEWHLKIIEKISKSRNASVNMKHANSFKNDVEVFPGFRPAVEACYLTWDSYRIPGVTYSDASEVYHCPFMCFRHSDGVSRSGETGQIHSSHAVLNNPVGEHHLLHSSATISSAPIKRPRSVDFGAAGVAAAEPQPGTSKTTSSSSNSQNPGPSSASTSKGKSSGTKGGSSKKMATLEDIISTVCGLKMSKSRDRQEQQSELSSFEDDVLLPSSTNGAAGQSSSSVSSSRSRIFEPMNLDERDPQQPGPSRHLLAQRQLSVDGNRSSISSEGFCENEPEVDTEASINDKDADEGVDVEIEGDGDLNLSTVSVVSTSKQNSDPEDFCDDSDSSISASRLRDVDLQSIVVNTQQDLSNLSSDSQSQQSGDEYQLYYYDPKASSSGTSSGGKKDDKKDKDSLGVNVFTNLKRIEGEWDVLFARAEGLHAHGHAQEACKLGVKLAEELLAHPPDLSLDLPHPTTGKGKRKKINPISHQISCLASATLAKCGFLCAVLAENSDYYYLAFRVGMFGLELSRPPASTKPLEVKLANQEAELAQFLKRIPLGNRELEMIREKAEALKIGTLKSRGEALLPLVLANFIFDALVIPAKGETRCTLQSGVYHLASDEALGFEAAVAALGLKANVSEADHPLLCEGTRRQRGDLALAMLLHYKDDPEKLSRIMDKLLDREIHQLCKVPLPAAYYSNNPPTTTLLNSATAKADEVEHPPQPPGTFNTGSGSSISNVPATAIDQPTQASSSAGPNAAGSTETSPIRPLSTASAEGESSTAAAASSSTNSAPAVVSTSTASSSMGHRSGKESGRFKGKRAYPVLPNQPSEAGAHFMFELGKVVLSRAGGSSNQSLFTQPSNGTNPRGPHRALHMCAFHIGLYALGLHNAVSPNWLSRTYSSHVSWITGQAMEIGAPAIVFLIDTWDSHLTPPEAVTIADRASRGDVNMVRAAAELALSCLPHASALNPNELHRAILQCKKQSDSMLEKACTTVETAAKGGGVCPEVLFDVARQWFSLYQKHLPMDVDLLNDEFGHHDSLLVDPTLDPMNPNASLHQQQMISVQTGLPVLNPNNPPLPTPSLNSTPPLQQQQQQQQSMEANMRLPPQDNRPQPPPQYQSMPYGAGFPPQFIPAANCNFNPMPMTMYPQLIYQPNGPSHPPMNSGYYAQHPSNQQGPIYSPPGMHQHSQLPHPSLMSAGPALQYYTHTPVSSNNIQVPITSSGNPMRPTQFFPMAPMGLHHNHNHNGMGHGSSQIPTPSHPHLAVMATAASGGNHGHSIAGHLVAIQSHGNPPQSGQPIMIQGPPVSSGNGQGHPHQHQHQVHSMNMNRGNGQPVMNQHFNNQMLHQLGAHGNGNGMPEQLMHGNPMCARDLLNHQPANGQTALKLKYLLATYRVGMLAMESLARSRDDRPTAKFSRNPLHGEDIKWVLSISRRLGAQYVQQFCICAMQSITNPFTLHEIILDAASFYTYIQQSSRGSLAWVYQNPRSPLAPLVQKCHQMYFQCLHQKLYHITAAEYDDFVNIVCTARKAFHLTPEGISQFKEWLQNLRRSKACKKDLLSDISKALQTNAK